MIRIKNTLNQNDLIYINSFVIANEVQLLLCEKRTGKIILIPYNQYVKENFKVEFAL